MQGSTDLDELVRACRDSTAREHFTEAVTCFAAGAYRACIVACWIAVVHDFVAKIDELAQAGVPNAKAKLAEYQLAVANNDKVRFLNFERSIPSYARNDLNIISEIEADDIERLQQDRHRCAHPSIVATGEPYRPGPETARYHLRNAAVHLLSREPIQGKWAVERALCTLKSSVFPLDREQMAIELRNDVLRQPSDAAFRSVLSQALKSLLIDPDGGFEITGSKATIFGSHDHENATKRLMLFIGGLRDVHGQKFLACKDQIGAICERTDEKWLPRLIRICGSVDGIWDCLRTNTIEKARRYIATAKIEDHKFIVPSAIRIRDARAAIFELLRRGSVSAWLHLPENEIGDETLSLASEVYVQSSDFYLTNAIASRVLLPNIAKLHPYAERIVKATSGRCVGNAHEHKRVLESLLVDKVMTKEAMLDALTGVGEESRMPVA